MTTYEERKAQLKTKSATDPIVWEESLTYRESKYRQLKHQEGLMGTIKLRLLEARNLQRDKENWSALALGPVKHLGLSNAWGDVSSFCRFSVNRKRKYYDSCVIKNNNNPKWNDHASFSIPLHKGTTDDIDKEVDNRVLIQVEVLEDQTSMESLLPNNPSYNPLLGAGLFDMTPMLLGHEYNNSYIQNYEVGSTKEGETTAVIDTWIPLNRASKAATASNSCSTKKEETSVGQIRILVTYEPHGLTPEPNDIVALESFARRNETQSTCPLILPPFNPLIVLAVSNSYLHARYYINNQSYQIRLHRNAVFVIERTSFVDTLVNLSLTPVDIVLNTPIVKSVSHQVSPITHAVSEAAMPALLTTKLAFNAAKTGVNAGVIGMGSIFGVVLDAVKESAGLNPPSWDEQHINRQSNHSGVL